MTAKFVDGLRFTVKNRSSSGWVSRWAARRWRGWMIRLGGTHLVPLVNLLNEQMLEQPLIHCDETRLQVLNSDKAPTADHWMWVRAAGTQGRRIVLFDYDPTRGGAVPKRLLEGYQGILLTDGYEPYATVAAELKLVHAGCMAHARRKFDDARKAQPGDNSSARTARTSSASSTSSSARCGIATIRSLPSSESRSARPVQPRSWSASTPGSRH